MYNKLRLEAIEWLINEASNNQIDGLLVIIRDKDYELGVDLLIDDDDEYMEFKRKIKDE